MPEAVSSKQTSNVSRRNLLKGGGALVVSFSMSALPTPAAADFPDVPPNQLDSWLAISEDGTVTGRTGRIEMGTGVTTVYTQAIAEELDVPVSAVRFILGDTALVPEQGKSTASNSVTLNLPPMRQAAAEARFVLLELAAKKFDVPVAQLTVTDGVVQISGDPSRRVSYGELIGGRRFDVTVGVKGSGISTQLLGRGKLKEPSQFRMLGKSVPRVDVPTKVTGEFSYVHDVRLEGMLHGTVVLPPAVGAELLSVEGLARPIHGIVKIVTTGNFVGIVAETEQAAVQARNEIRVKWSAAKGPDLKDVYGVIMNAPVQKDLLENEWGDVDGGLAKADFIFDNTYRLPYNSHGMIGPSCSVADWREDALTIYSGTQWPDGTRTSVAEILGMPKSKVRLIWVQAAGSYGRLGVDDAAADAALLSQAVGRPVRVQWQRRDEHAWGPYNPGAVIKIRAGLDKSGKVVGWDYQNWTTSHSIDEVGNVMAWRLIGNNPGNDRLSGSIRSSPMNYSDKKLISTPSSDPQCYTFESVRLNSHYRKEITRSIYMRSVGSIQNTFAIESMMDEMAAKVGADPIEFRLRHLPLGPRMKAVLQAVAKLANWKAGPRQTLKAGPGILAGRGVALFGQGRNSAYVATIVDVEVTKATGEVYVRRVYVGFDAGRVINPDGLRNQIEGATLMGISRGLKEEVTFSGRRVTISDWASYPVLTFTEVPESIEMVILDNDHPPMGAGEPPNVTPAGAIGNAIAHATGVRLRELPLTPGRVLSQLGA